MQVVFKKPDAMTDIPFPYCPGCSHGTIHRLVAEGRPKSPRLPPFVFLDEQADTLNDGFFVNHLEDYYWGNVPGSYHGGSANFSFADGHLESHRWLVSNTIQPVPPHAHRQVPRFPSH